ncbi:thioredoxin [Sporocytophaga myxococcoides]|uniref:Thioredoxin n=1 Tax=Sporocytophaga myxococcoides TaxID=153721 RepID=A0A098LGT2_9BACT|nr:thioredoxin [Sporocytophaga myxococcoides]GAL85679.1 thioredoxin [Sporocytophaga myxococcoides]
MENGTKYLELTDGNFETEVIKTSTPVLVDFSAEWCGPCKMMGPIIEDLANEYEGKAKITKIDVDVNPQTTSKYGVRSLPTLLIFKDGNVVDKIIGAVPKRVITEKLGAHIN